MRQAQRLGKAYDIGYVLSSSSQAVFLSPARQVRHDRGVLAHIQRPNTLRAVEFVTTQRYEVGSQ
jgi:hypothetical protein